MNSVDTFKCARLKKTFTVGRCIRNQKDALAFWGPDAARYQSCPCDQGIKIRQQMEGTMSAKAICRNCGRKMAIMQDHMCGGCCGRSRGLTGEAKEAALAKAREDFMGKEPKSRGNYRPRKPKVEEKPKTDPGSGAIAAGSPLGGKTKVEEKPKEDSLASFIKERCIIEQGPDKNDHIIVLRFDDGDSALLDNVRALARRFRREPAQQILWMIDKGFDYFNDLSGEEVAHG